MDKISNADWNGIREDETMADYHRRMMLQTAQEFAKEYQKQKTGGKEKENGNI